ncbi:tyrosine-type recombinase/integrase [Streptococcus mitis]|uniref:tyrosine-type recombinase/integrase n=1 Tax=Streptococcus mitis TaxID=28037 RepID=UPI00398BDF73
MLDKYHKDSNTLDIHTTFNRYIPDDDGTKTFASFRTTHLTKREIEILDKMIELNQLSENTDPNWYKSTRIFVTNTDKLIHSSILSKSLQRANERLKQPIPKHLSPHIFRHTTINILAENKIPLKIITGRVGHSDSEVTTSIYSHVTKNMKDEAINVLDKVMKKIF